MYVENVSKHFYDFLSGKRIFLMVHYDIDSICACKILQSLLKYKHILYSLAVIRGLEDLRIAYNENSKDVQYFVLINCGGTIDLVEFLEAEDDQVFFVLDSHRPTDLCNIYSSGQVRLLHRPEEDSSVPEFDEIFQEDSDVDESDEENQAKRRRLGEEEILKRRERRLWEENRDKLIFEYSQFTYYAKASALHMFDLAWNLNKDDKEMLWLAIVGLTEQLVLEKIENSQYVLEVDTLQTHANRLHNRTNDTDVLTSLKIHLEKDVRLALYRHWSIVDSLRYTMYTAIKLKQISNRGENKKLQELLAEMGIPLIQGNQTFKAMDLELRKEFLSSLEKLSEKYHLDDIMMTTFTLQFGFRNKYCASDFVYALLSILESSGKEKKPEECFNLALDCLKRTKKEVIDHSIDKAKLIFKAINKTVQNAIDMKQVIIAGPFVYFIIQEGCVDWFMFSNPHILSLLAHYMLNAYVAKSRNRKAPTLPLIVSAPKNVETGTCILVGIPPLCENSPKTFLGKAFIQVAERLKCDASCDYFDPSYFEIHTKDRMRFLDALTALLT